MALNIIRELPHPSELKAAHPLSQELIDIKAERDREIKKIFSGESDKFLLVIGPCSADNEDSVLDYITRLRGLQEKVSDKIMMIPRIYTGKPRTTGDGYKGMLHQPDPTAMPDLKSGIIAVRHLHMRALAETGFSCADEMLYPENYSYLDDLLSYIAIGARSVENQQHRLVSSGVDIPVGMKNPTGGDISVMMNSITAAQHHHAFIYRGCEVRSDGNPYAHAILRGYVNDRGQSFPNYHFEDLISLARIYAEKDLKNPALIVDTNHSNSGKQHLQQVRIAKEVLTQRRLNPDIRALVRGFITESYLVDGCQKPEHAAVYGQSVTDPCLGWEKTEKLLYELAEMV